MSPVVEKKLTKKQRKAAAFRQRQGKGKATLDFTYDNSVPVQEDIQDEDIDTSPQVSTSTPETASGKEPPKKSSKKHRRDEPDLANPASEGEDKPPSKKRKQAEANEDLIEGIAEGTDDAGAKAKENTKQRYILFIGNLKYTTSVEAIQKHFSFCDPPPVVRLLTPKRDPSKAPTVAKSKGCAFAEFSNHNALQQGLTLHQSQLDGRAINVELTAGGGGNSENRLAKLKERNKKVHTQRKHATGSGNDTTLPGPQRYSATSGLEQAPLKKKTWTIDDEGDGKMHRGGVKHARRGKCRNKAMGTGVNAIPVG
ncbi:hypothetical protein FISHEDRAFT_37248 [Fistulina hepatica ATCC 64428]|uniref:RRM domain-containing protein n=1 Tax=Fistulina hepatica ATCC 64428 TaxID=1128425 RepID=A0A0D7AIV4_9AGAR|nr:hypothetical protein FISHEDRAFT_37248 [Fistulina hepatica ATCC 64428]